MEMDNVDIMDIPSSKLDKMLDKQIELIQYYQFYYKNIDSLRQQLFFTEQKDKQKMLKTCINAQKDWLSNFR